MAIEFIPFIPGFLGIIILVGTFIQVIEEGTQNIDREDMWRGIIIGGGLLLLAIFLDSI